jgi:hypothetical protein
MSVIPDARELLNYILTKYPDIKPAVNPVNNLVQTYPEVATLRQLEKALLEGKVKIPEKGVFFEAGVGTGQIIPIMVDILSPLIGLRSTYLNDISKSQLSLARHTRNIVCDEHTMGYFVFEAPSDLGDMEPRTVVPLEDRILDPFDKRLLRFPEGDPRRELYVSWKQLVLDMKTWLLEDRRRSEFPMFTYLKRMFEVEESYDRPPIALAHTNQTLHWLSQAKKLRFLTALWEASTEGAILNGNISALGSAFPLIPAIVKTYREMGQYDLNKNPDGIDSLNPDYNPIGSVSKSALKSVLNRTGWELAAPLELLATDIVFKNPIEYLHAARKFGKKKFVELFVLGEAEALMDQVWNKIEENFLYLLAVGPDSAEARKYIPEKMQKYAKWDQWTRDSGDPWTYHTYDWIFTAVSTKTPESFALYLSHFRKPA